jgi:hypothetical protein
MKRYEHRRFCVLVRFNSLRAAENYKPEKKFADNYDLVDGVTEEKRKKPFCWYRVYQIKAELI